MRVLDIQYIYLLRRRGRKIDCLFAVRVPFARKREQRLHNMFRRSRFQMTKKQKVAPRGLLSIAESQCKIGITNNLPRRLGRIQADKLSGKTEWFALSRAERLAVRYWLFKWKVKWLCTCFIIASTLIVFLMMLFY